MFESLVTRLQRAASEKPRDVAATYLEDGEDREVTVDYAELDRWAGGIASQLAERFAPGDRVLLMHPAGLEFIAAFLGCLYARIIAVPVHPPGLRDFDRDARRIGRLGSRCGARAVLAAESLRAKRPAFVERSGDLAALVWLASEGRAPDAGPARGDDVRPDDIAFLQYTSGSTAEPKGVMVSHRNLVANLAAYQPAMGIDSASVFLGWLPLYHDMGLIGTAIGALYRARPLILMSPMHFIQRPIRWPAAVSKYRATFSGGPNFAYELCVRKSTHEQRAALDLSCWKTAFNGAEPVRAATLDAFADAFAVAGLTRRALFPCYGLAEATLYVSGGSTDEEPVVRRFDKAALDVNTAKVNESESGVDLVSSGRASPDHRVVIVDPERRTPLPPGSVGEIWFQGPSVASGYWSARDMSGEPFRARLEGPPGRYLRTGDLGFQLDGELFVSGRIKDLLIMDGRNIHPQDIERTIDGVDPAIRPGNGAAFAVDAEGSEAVAAVQELRPEWKGDFQKLAREVARAVLEAHGVDLRGVVFIEAGSLPKTSSGKVQRRAARAALEARRLAILYEHWWVGGVGSA